MKTVRFSSFVSFALLFGGCTPTSAPPDTADGPAAAPAQPAGQGGAIDAAAPSLLAFNCQCDSPPPLEPKPTIPDDVSLDVVQKCEERPRDRPCQPCFDCFGWQLFIGMNWPAGSRRGEPDPNATFGRPGDLSPLVWETYANVRDDIFDRRELPPWDEIAAGDKALPLTGLRGKLQADGYWLTDREGNLVRYEIRANRDLYDYIRDNKLNTKAGLFAAFKTGRGVSLPAGTTEIKAAWRVVPAGEEEHFKAKYKVSKAKVDGVPRLVALIGLHIAKKTPKLHQWSWATFEHEANAPPASGTVDPRKRYNLFNAGLPGDYTPNYNSPPDAHGRPPTPKERPVQVKREVPMGPSAVVLNAYMQDMIARAFRESVWRHYRLVDVQWPMKPGAIDAKPTTPPRDGDPRPRVVANLTMETYMQHKDSGGGAGVAYSNVHGDPGLTPLPRGMEDERGKSSCIGCHRLSSVTPDFSALGGSKEDRWHTDYSTIFFLAK